jgi:16S rRNA (uracil1498-N3)-methyltransferase
LELRDSPVPCAIMTGPEGGFAPDELDQLGELPFVRSIGLGPRVLRADTAALAALSVVQAIAGDWDSARS